jgi:hypothetical protein
VTEHQRKDPKKNDIISKWKLVETSDRMSKPNKKKRRNNSPEKYPAEKKKSSSNFFRL